MRKHNYILFPLIVLTIVGYFLVFKNDFQQQERLQIKLKPIVVQVTTLGKLPWNPKTSNATKQIFNSAVHRPLIKISENFRLEAGVFRDWLWDQKTSSYILTLNENLKYHNGASLSIDDVEYAILKKYFNRIEDFDEKFFSQIVGIDNLKSDIAFSTGVVPGIQKVSEHQLRIFLKKNDPSFLYKLSIYSSPVQPKEHSMRSERRNQAPIGLGPYKVINYNIKSSSVLVERISPCKSCPKLIKFIESGEPNDNVVDIGCGPAARKLLENKKYKFKRGKINSAIVVLDFNFRNNLSRKMEFRSLVANSIDRKKLFKSLPSTIPFYSLIPKHLYGRINEDFVSQKLVSIDAKTNGLPRSEIKGWYHGRSGEDSPEYIKVLKGQLAEQGLKVDFRPTLKHSFGDEDSTVSFYIYRLSGLIADPTILLSTYIENDIRSSHSPVENGQVQNLLGDYRAESSTFKKAKILQHILKLFSKNYIQVPLGASFPTYSISPRIKSLHLEKQMHTIDFDLVTIEENNSK